jgi:hypothetical protein
MAAVELALGGSTELAQRRFESLWDSLPADDFFHRCVLAHYMADTQTDPLLELEWDQRCLDAALSAPTESFENRLPDVSRASFLPSLYLNLAASHERIGDLSNARHYAEQARRSLADVPDTALGNLTRSAIERLCLRVVP